MEHQGATVVAVDEQGFAAAMERHRHELRVHCYRMLGSFHDAEDLVQETFLRAWRRRSTFRAESSVRAWLYKIATNACLDFAARENRRATRYLGPALVESSTGGSAPADVAWLEPYPDRLLDPGSLRRGDPDAAAIDRETIELAFLVAIQQLPPRQRAVLVLRDVLGWPAADTAAALDSTVASVKSALQRARTALKAHLPARRDEWRRPAEAPSPDELALARRFAEAHQRADFATIAALLADDVRQTMPPEPAWLVGRDALLELTGRVLDPASSWYHGEWRSVLTAANRQPAIAHYVERPSAPETRDLPGRFRAQGVDVLSIRDGRISAITTFGPRHFGLFDLPWVLA